MEIKNNNGLVTKIYALFFSVIIRHAFKAVEYLAPRLVRHRSFGALPVTP